MYLIYLGKSLKLKKSKLKTIKFIKNIVNNQLITDENASKNQR
jgi:hypothetical protein